MNILVTGASGFLGAQTVTDLLKAGHQVTCCVRDIQYTKKLFSHAKVIYCDFLKDNSLEDWLPRLTNIDVVVNTVGIFYHPNQKIIWQTHFETPRALFDACIVAKVKKIIQISALGVDHYQVEYAKSKLKADEYLLKLPISSVILRPSLIYGQGSYGGTSLLRGMSGLPFFIPMPGQGRQTFQPIYLADLSKAIVNLIEKMSNESLILDAVSDHTITLKEILLTIRQWLALPKAYPLPIPYFLMYIGIFLGNFIPSSVINKSGYKMLMQNNITTKEATEQFIHTVGFKPRHFEEGMFSKPSTVQDRWHARLFLMKPLLQFSLAFLWIFTAICSVWLYPLTDSYSLLDQIGITRSWQPLFLYGAALMDFLIGCTLLLNYKVRTICLLQSLLIIFYSLIIAVKLPVYWLHPFGPLTKNIFVLICIYFLYVLDHRR